ncbi:hypothetical protein [Marinomonas sp. THO17]|uniref:hypothetical protein n=1 Tax=Marinomonas sp. THO17 TaxID=3149048 RepID=UPI00336BEF8B
MKRLTSVFLLSGYSLNNDSTPMSSIDSKIKTRILPGGGQGPYFTTIANIGSGSSISWDKNKYVDKLPYGVFEKSDFTNT